MNRVDKKFSELKVAGKKALITFITAGDPSLDMTKKLVLEMEKNGADLIELGVPFSDPIAEGPVIQEANIRALKVGVNLEKIFCCVAELRRETQIPLVFLMYFNSILSYGLDAFFARCKEAGIDGVIIPDLPFEESDEIAEYTEKYGVYQISMIAPTSTEERIQKICERARGFLYCVSSLGVTGTRQEFKTDFSTLFESINKYAKIPRCIGFGISSPEQIKELQGYCDGLIIGSAVIKQIANASTDAEKISAVGDFTKSLAAEL